MSKLTVTRTSGHTVWSELFAEEWPWTVCDEGVAVALFHEETVAHVFVALMNAHDGED